MLQMEGGTRELLQNVEVVDSFNPGLLLSSNPKLWIFECRLLETWQPFWYKILRNIVRINDRDNFSLNIFQFTPLVSRHMWSADVVCSLRRVGGWMTTTNDNLPFAGKLSWSSFLYDYSCNWTLFWGRGGYICYYFSQVTVSPWGLRGNP